MAKSLRSKQRRKMRSVKREKYGKKELERLKGVIQNFQSTEVDMKEVSIVKSAKEVKDESSGEQMETNRASGKFNPKTLRNEHGNYPVWMNQRKVKKLKQDIKKKEKRKAKAKKQSKRL